MKIIVTNDDIAQGKAGDCEACPIAIAARRVLNRAVKVHIDWMEVEGSAYDLPVEASRFVSLFDENEAVEPLEFDLIAA